MKLDNSTEIHYWSEIICKPGHHSNWKRHVTASTWNHDLTHQNRVMYICSSKLRHYRFKLWLVTCLVPGHYLSKCWIIVSQNIGNTFQWNFIQNSNIFIKKDMNLIMLSERWWPFCLGFIMLKQSWYIMQWIPQNSQYSVEILHIYNILIQGNALYFLLCCCHCHPHVVWEKEMS